MLVDFKFFFFFFSFFVFPLSLPKGAGQSFRQRLGATPTDAAAVIVTQLYEYLHTRADTCLTGHLLAVFNSQQ
jgi:hypothetical protein